MVSLEVALVELIEDVGEDVMVESDGELEVSCVFELHVAGVVLEHVLEQLVVSEYLRGGHDAIILPRDEVHGEVKLIIEVCIANRRLASVAQQISPLPMIIGSELVALVPLSELEHHVDGGDAERVARVVHLLEGPVLRLAADDHGADAVDEL